MNVPNDRLTVGVNEAAGLLGVTGRFVAMLIARGELPSLRLGRRRLIRIDALREFIERREREQAQ